MKLNRLFVIIIYASLIACGGPKTETVWEAMKMEGKVKSLKTVWFHAINQEGNMLLGQPTKRYFDSLVFNESGQLIEEYSIDSSHVIDSHTSFSYTSDGKHLLTICNDTKGELIYKEVYTYDDETRTSLFLRYLADGAIDAKEKK